MTICATASTAVGGHGMAVNLIAAVVRPQASPYSSLLFSLSATESVAASGIAGVVVTVASA